MSKLLDTGDTTTMEEKSLALEKYWAEFVYLPVRVENLYFMGHQAEFSGHWHSRGNTSP